MVVEVVASPRVTLAELLRVAADDALRLADRLDASEDFEAASRAARIAHDVSFVGGELAKLHRATRPRCVCETDGFCQACRS